MIEHAQLAKQPDLVGGERLIGNLSAGEVTHQQRDAVVFGLRAWRQCGSFVRGDAEPVHAGIDMERRTAAPVLGGNKGVPLGQLGRAVDHRLDVEFSERVGGLWRKAVEHVDCGVVRAGACAPRFGDVGDEKSLASGLGKLRSDRLETEPVGIGLDHGAAFDGEKLAAKRAPVRLDGIEIDRERPAGLRVEQAGCRFRQRLCECHAAL